MNIDLVLYIIALVFFALSFFNVASRFNLVAGGLFCWLLAAVI